MARKPGEPGLRLRIWQGVLELDRLVRVHFLFFSAVWPLLGASSVNRYQSIAHATGLLVVAACCHVYGVVLNDLVDLPIDRTNPSRRSDTLVRGAIRPRTALAIALLQPVLTIPVTMWLGGNLRAQATLAAFYTLMGIYDVWGKRCPVPPLTDAVQGLAWASLTIYGAQIAAGASNPLAWIVAAYATGFALFMNGIHGGLRDLDNDLRHGARTTAIFLGARPDPAGGDPHVPSPVAAFAWCVLAILIGLNAVLLARNDFGYGPTALLTTATVVGGLTVLAVGLMSSVIRPRGSFWNVAFRLQIYVVLMSLPAAFTVYVSKTVLCVLLLLTVLSLSVLEWTPRILQWIALTLLNVEARSVSKTDKSNTDPILQRTGPSQP